MAIIAKSVTLNAGPAQTLLETGSGEGKIVLLRDASADIYLGGDGVTTAQGFKLATTDVLSITLLPGDSLYAIATSGTPTVRVMTTRDNT